MVVASEIGGGALGGGGDEGGVCGKESVELEKVVKMVFLERVVEEGGGGYSEERVIGWWLWWWRSGDRVFIQRESEF